MIIDDMHKIWALASEIQKRSKSKVVDEAAEQIKASIIEMKKVIGIE